MTRYEIVRDYVLSEIVGISREVATQRHPEQPSDGFASASEASLWCETPPRQLGGEWYLRPVEG